MENASKALIIAGAILISILLIGLGVYIYNQAQSTISSATLDSEVAQAQNQKFEVYKGNNISSAQVKQLLSLINTNNITSSTNEEYKTIGIRFRYAEKSGDKKLKYYENEREMYTTDINGISELLRPGSTYKVSIPGVKAYDATKKGNDGFEGDPRWTDEWSAYYSNGYIRLFDIEENIEVQETEYTV